MAASSHSAARSRPAPAPLRIRWDRVGRVSLLVVFAVIVYLYLGPARAWVTAYGEAKDRRGQVAQLRSHNEELRRRDHELRRTAALEREARRLGMVKAGERGYVVEGLPR